MDLRYGPVSDSSRRGRGSRSRWLARASTSETGIGEKRRVGGGEGICGGRRETRAEESRKEGRESGVGGEERGKGKGKGKGS